MLQPTENTSLRRALEKRFRERHIAPCMVAEFEDLALIPGNPFPERVTKRPEATNEARYGAGADFAVQPRDSYQPGMR